MKITDWIEIEVTVDGDYQPAEKQTWDYPGCPASFTNISVFLGDLDITDELTSDQIESIERRMLEAKEDEY